MILLIFTKSVLCSHSLFKSLNIFVAVLFLFCTAVAPLKAQVKTDREKKNKRYFLTGLPVVYYTPETRFAFGASGIILFNFKNDSALAPKSITSLSFIYTQNNQILLSLPFNIFIKNRAYQTYGEITYNRFNYNFYGVGHHEPLSYVERYGVEFPRVRLTFLKQLFKNFYAGPRFAFDQYRLFNLDSTGKLINGTIPGSHGGKVSGIGAVLMYDSRDNVFYPGRGLWSELVVYHDDPLTGSSFNYTRIAFDFSKYFRYKQNILAVNLYSIYSDSDLPFFQMGTLGGIKKMRGFYEGRYRDNNLLVLQAEYRRMVFGPLGFTVFADAGQVANRYDRFNKSDWKYTYGAGLRVMFDKVQKINLRLDFAVGNQKLLTYFTVAEAF